MGRRILSVLLALLMLLTLMPVGALAEGETSGSITMDGVTYYTLESGVLTVSGEGACSNEWKNTFDKDAVTEVVIEDGVTGIVGDSFCDCANLGSITIPASVYGIGYAAFSNTAYYNDESNWENGVLYIGDCLISAKTDISGVCTIKDGTRLVADYAFSGCASLEGVVIPDSVTSIGDGVFSGCMALESVEVSEGNVNYISLDGVLYDSDQFELIFCSRGKTGSFVVPDSVMSIGGGAFDGCTGLTSITIPGSVDSFGDFAFSGCTGLKSVTYQGMTYALENGVLTVSGEGECSDMWKYVLDANAVTEVVIKDGVIFIGSSAFSWCENMASVTIPVTVNEIGSSAFSGCTSLTSITMPDGVECINHDAFSNTAYFNDETNWENGVLYIGNCLIQAKEDISGECTIKDGTRLIANYAFHGCVGMTGVTIPNSVTIIGDYAFYGCTGLTSVAIPDNVESIYYTTFEKCTSLAGFTYKGFTYALENGVLTISGEGECTDDWGKILDDSTITEVVIKNGVTSIGAQAFSYCESLESITIPDSVTSIGDDAFYWCTSLESVTIPDSVTSIGDYAFSYCTSLTSATIGSGVTSIGDYAFSYCTELSSIDVAEGNANYASVDGVLYNKDKTKLILCPPSKTGSIVVPDGVTDISDDAFNYCRSLESVTIPGSVKSVGVSTFYSCRSLTSVTIGDGVMSIGDDAFRDCVSLTSVTIPDSVTSIGNSAFSGCTSLASIAIGNGVTSIGDDAFRDCVSLTSVVIPDGVTSIGSDAFYWCTSLESVTIPDSVESIGDGAFSVTALSRDGSNRENGVLYIGNCLIDAKMDISGAYTIKDGTRLVAGGAFSSCSGLTSITIPESVANIGERAFQSCKNITEITLPAGVKNVADHAFSYCTSLTSVTMPDSVTSIGDYAFRYCKSLESVTIPDGVTSIGIWTFEGCTSLESVTIPDSVTNIGIWAFENCASLASVTMGSGVTSIGDWAFENCTSLASITIPNGVTSIACGVFFGCTSLASVTMGNGVTIIGGEAFRGCTSLTSVTIPDGVTYIGDQVFEDCTNLAEVSVPESVENIRADVLKNTAYYNNEANWENGVLYIGKNLMNAKSELSGAYKVKDDTKVLAASSLAGTAIESAEIPASVTEIAYGLFQGCASLKSVTLPDTIQSIGMLAFAGCESLTDVYYGGTQEQWNAIDIHRGSCYPTDATIHYTQPHVHSYTDVVTAPTCTEKGYTTHTCACGESFVDSYVDAKGHDTEIKNAKDATCTEKGYTGDEVCTVCSETVKAGSEIGAKGHDTEIKNAKAATATEKGYTGDEVCKVCGVTVKTGEVIPELGEEHTHSYTDVVTAPTCTEKGYTTHTCACGESYKDSYVDALGHKYENGVCVRCGEADPNADTPTENPFTDVSSEKYFYAPVMWAVNHEPQITGGYTDGTFRPQNTCTRAQIVTFLWRAKGCPEPTGTSCTFTDVAPGAYYYKAVLWAVENGITGGYDAQTFGSNDTVTRAQAMTFLWRAAGKPAAPAGTVNTFTDVSPTSYYYEAVLWAVANGVTGGYNETTFGSNDGCTRGQIVTFLFRDMA